MKTWKNVFGFIVMMIVAGSIAGVGFGYYKYREWIVNGNLMDVHTIGVEKPNVTTKILDRNGKEIGEIFVERRTIVPFQEIPDVVKHAFLSAEDKNFYRHDGVDLGALAKAGAQGILSRRKLRGASTITQQAIKVWSGNNERTARRKFQEMVLATRLEKIKSKDEIFSLYLNKIYLGRQRFGVEAASQYLFGKSVREIDLHEAALLASLPKAPETYYRPDHHKSWRMREAYVLGQMVKNGYAEKAKADEALNQPIKLVKHDDDIAPEFLDLAEKELRAKYGNDLGTQGLTVKTTCDLEYQRIARTALKKGLDEIDAKNKERPRPQGAVIVLDVKTREVLAMVGGYEQRRADFNRALGAKRQPGSTFKSIVWAAALEQPWLEDPQTHFSPSMTLIDTEKEYEIPGSEPWKPKNHSEATEKPVTLRYALAHSYNTISAQITDLIGADAVVEMAKRLGITTELRRPLGHKGELIAPLSLALGTSEVTPIEMANAYATIADQGKRADPSFLLSEEPTSVKKTKAISPSLAYLMTSLLTSVVQDGTGRKAKGQIKQPIAGKTGTTQSATDAWFVGYSPEFVVAVWVGNDNNKPLGDHWEGSRAALPIWVSVMKEIHRNRPMTSFVRPSGIVEQDDEIYLAGKVPPPRPEDETDPAPSDEKKPDEKPAGAETEEVAKTTASSSKAVAFVDPWAN